MKRWGIVFLFLLSGCNSESISPPTVTSQNLASTELTHGNSDLQGFVAAVKDYDFVSVGERTHQGSKAYSYKARMVKALHQEGDLTLVAFEAGLYDGLVAWQNFLTGKQRLQQALIGPNANYMYGHRFSKEVGALANYFNEVSQQDNPLLLIGYDARINSDPGCSVMFDELRSYLQINSLGLFNYDTIQTLGPRMMCPWLTTEKFTSQNHQDLTQELKKLETVLTTQKRLETVPDYDPSHPREFRNYATFWLQIVRSLYSQSYFIINNIDHSYTDYQSAENLNWLINEWFKIQGQTFIWAHNIHATPIPGSLISAINSRYPDRSVYSVMQLSYKGLLAANTPDYTRWLINTEHLQEEDGTLNSALYHAGYTDAFIDFKSQSESNIDYLNKPYAIRYAWGYLPTEIPSKIMDGILFVAEEQPAQPISDAPLP
ncbi:erythromycin esterase family protein [Vibrio cholerae]|nr:erythromycin esterase family protein [Vibrio cholerae]